MKLGLMVTVALLGSLCAPANATDIQGAIEFQTGYVGSSSAWIPWHNFPAIGSSLFVVGLVDHFNAPFQDLLPPAGTYEATYSIEGLMCTDNILWDDFVHGVGGMAAGYSDGTLRIYVDSTPDADPADPSTFEDGELVLEAQLIPRDYMGEFLLMDGGCCYPSVETLSGCFEFSGGAWFSRVKSADGDGCRAVIAGCFRGSIPDELREMGYVGQSSSRLDLYAVVTVKSATWGGIKSLFR
jgi:hypothetical protein